MLDGLFSAAGNIAGALISKSASDKNNETTWKLANLNREDQYRFAREGVRWKVEDAQKAGIHPLAALGVSTPYSPVSANFSTPDTSGFGRAGQALGASLDRKIASADREKEAARQRDMQEEMHNARLAHMGAQTQLLLKQASPTVQPRLQPARDAIPGKPGSPPARSGDPRRQSLKLWEPIQDPHGS